MPRKKKIPGKTGLPEKPTGALPSESNEQGLWIDPEISRRIKGERGRRGVEGLPSTTRFLDYADNTQPDTPAPETQTPPRKKR